MTVARKTLVKYMEKEYRPYAVTDLIGNLHNAITKALIIRLLDELVDKGTLIVKKYGKSSFYCYSELQVNEDMETTNLEKLQATKAEICSLEKEATKLKSILEKIKAEPSDKEIQLQVDELTTKQAYLRQEIDKHTTFPNSIDSTEVTTRIKKIEMKEKNVTENYKKIKKIVSIATTQEPTPITRTNKQQFFHQAHRDLRHFAGRGGWF
ncbi:hypothetical protein JL09_g2797 [Pichia kudriavzevii]|uniref:Homologous-pairing protein 2 winged helix domain-containing protein n=1 Tax=Pichia kudriavzevii TaxID=4909 RepID=A0A099P1T6_PICKU|nr:hypothetical protein JL09_g2797 [Pichia kudriavzevii]